MEITEKTARLGFCGNFIEISDFICSEMTADAGNPYNTSFRLRVKSGDFCGTALCEYDIAEFRRFISEIDDLYEFRSDTAEMNDISYGSKVVFETDRLGHIRVSGLIYGHAAIHSLQFEFDADQTALKPFADGLKRLI